MCNPLMLVNFTAARGEVCSIKFVRDLQKICTSNRTVILHGSVLIARLRAFIMHSWYLVCFEEVVIAFLAYLKLLNLHINNSFQKVKGFTQKMSS